MMKTEKIALYVHVPFCESKCTYCAFCSFVANKKIVKTYFEMLETEIFDMSEIFPNKIVTSIYFGGGTPSSVDAENIKHVVKKILELFTVDKDAEITIECNPNSATRDKLKAYKDMGFNRVSFGVQSLDDESLLKIGRLHTSKQVIDAVENAKLCGFNNISADLLIGIENQTSEKLIHDANALVSLGVKHLSAYMLSVEENTPLWHSVNQGAVLLPSDDFCADMYDELLDFMESKGFHRYEVSNFALKGFESKHNLTYWKCNDYLGVGLSAHSFVQNKRFFNTSNLSYYLNGKRKENEEIIDKQKQIEEYIMLALRLENGIDLNEFQKKFGVCLQESQKSEIQELLTLNLIKILDGRLFVLPKKFGVLNQIILKLI